MLARLEAGLERERRFVDDASHELRTPLALQKAELELALREGGDAAALRAAIASAIEEVDRMIGLAEALLVVARSGEEAALHREPLETADLLGGIAARFEARATERRARDRGRAGRPGRADRRPHPPRAGRSPAWSRTRSATARARCRCPRGRTATAVELHVSRRGAAGSRTGSPPMPSSASAAPTRRAHGVGSASGSRSRRRSPARTAATRASRTAPAAAPTSGSRCRFAELYRLSRSFHRALVGWPAER